MVKLRWDRGVEIELSERFMVSHEEFRDFFNKFDGKFEPEMRIIFSNRDKEYMIIKYQNCVTFQRCGVHDGSGEIRFEDLDELYNMRTIDGILLKEEWGNIKDIVVDEMYSVAVDWDDIKEYEKN